jgi:hypothetical protein
MCFDPDLDMYVKNFELRVNKILVLIVFLKR